MLGGLDIRVAQLGFAAQATCGSAVDLHLAVMPHVCDDASLWAHDRAVANVIRPVPGQPAQRAPPRSLPRDMAYAKLLSRILSAAEAVQAARLDHGLPFEQQAIMLSAGGPGTGTMCTAMHKSPTGARSTAQWRVTTALRIGLVPDASPCATCALRRRSV